MEYWKLFLQLIGRELSVIKSIMNGGNITLRNVHGFYSPRERGRVNCILNESTCAKKKKIAIIDQMVWLKFRKPVLRVRRTKFEFIIKNVFSRVLWKKRTNKYYTFLAWVRVSEKGSKNEYLARDTSMIPPKRRSLLTRNKDFTVYLFYRCRFGYFIGKTSVKIVT